MADRVRDDVPRPGRPVRGSTTGRPIMVALDLLGRRWMLRVLWELSGGPLGFSALQLACDSMSTSVLSQRLKELRVNGIATPDLSGAWALTALGRELLGTLAPLQTWSNKWARKTAGAKTRQSVAT